MALEVFKLFGSIMVNNEEANKSISETEGKAEGLGSKLLDGIGTAAKWGAAIAVAAGTAAVALGGVALNSADKYQKALNTLQAQTGSTNEEMKEFGEVVKGVYSNNFGEGFEDVANSVGLVIKNLQLSGDELQNVTELAIGFSDTFGVEVNESTRAAKTLMQQFGISAEQAYNVMAQGQQQGLDYSGELIDSINEYSVHFSQLGLNVEDMFNVFADGAAAGAFNLDKIGDAVKELGIKIKEGSANEALEELGFSADEVVEKFNQGGEQAQEAFYGIFEALGKVEDQTKLNTLGTALMGTMFEDLGKEASIALGDMGDSFNRTINTAKQINEIKYNSFGQAIEGIKRQLETNIFIPIGQLILPSLNRFANWFANEGQTYLKAFSDVVMSVMPVVQGVFNTVFTAIEEIISAFMSMFAESMGDMNINWSTVIDALRIAWESYGKPIFDAFISIVKTLFENFSPIMGGLKTLFLTALSYIATIWQSQGKPVWDFFISIINKLAETFNYIFPILAQTFKGLCETIRLLWENILKPVFNVMGLFIQNVVLPIWKAEFNNISRIVKWAFEFIGTLWNTVLKPILDGVINFIGGIFKGDWSQIWAGIVGILKGIWGTIKLVIWSPIEWALNKISGIVESIVSPFRKAANAISNVWSSIRSVFKLPHFTISGSLNPVNWIKDGMPSIGVEWYAKGGVLTEPTIFGMNGPNAMVGGEAGPEAVAPIETLMKFINIAVLNALNAHLKDNKNGDMTVNIYSPEALTPSEVARQLKNTQRQIAYGL